MKECQVDCGFHENEYAEMSLGFWLKLFTQLATFNRNSLFQYRVISLLLHLKEDWLYLALTHNSPAYRAGALV